jgi:hypothetical protein
MANGEYQIARWRKPDGTLSTSRADAIRIDLDSLRSIIESVSSLPVEFMVVMAQNETGDKPAINQEDTDYYADGSVKKETFGIYQLTESERNAAGEYGADLLDPTVNVRVFSTIMERHLATIMETENKRRDGLGIERLTEPTIDVYRYLAWSHNNGIGAVTKSIAKYGLDWDALKARPQNEYMTGRLIPYAERATRSISHIVAAAVETASYAVDETVDFVETSLDEYADDSTVVGIGAFAIGVGLVVAYLLARG